MKKNIFNTVAIILVFTIAGHAQQTETKVEAVLRPDGTREIRLTGVDGKITTVTANDEATLRAKYLEIIQKRKSVAPAVINNSAPFVSHEAILGKDGTQEIHLTDASGKETIITAAKGESVQEKYWAYLQKEGLPCACSPTATLTDPSATKTAEKFANAVSTDEPGFIVSAKVSLEGGPIKKGDLLVASSKPGIAMKADPAKIKQSQVIGKAQQDFNDEAVGEIKVLINIK